MECEDLSPPTWISAVLFYRVKWSEALSENLENYLEPFKTTMTINWIELCRTLYFLPPSIVSLLSVLREWERRALFFPKSFLFPSELLISCFEIAKILGPLKLRVREGKNELQVPFYFYCFSFPFLSFL